MQQSSGLVPALLFALTAILTGMSAMPSEAKVERLLEQLGRSPKGREAINKALNLWAVTKVSELTSFIVLSDVSKTDAVISRTLDPKSEKEQRSRDVKILLKRDLPDEDLLLDLAHELAHAVEPPHWDPYDPELSAAEYLYLSLEGAGGEIEAVYQECIVARELELSNEKLRCERYLKSEGGKTTVSFDQIREDFYRVGPQLAMVQKTLGSVVSKFKFLSSKEPVLISSTGQAPYPVALLREYQELTEAACANSLNRIKSLPARSIASNQASRLIARRCTP